MIALSIGVINGIMVAFVEAPALFVTLAAGFVIYGLAFWFAPAWVVYAPKDAPGLLFLGAGRIFGIPVPIFVFAAAALAIYDIAVSEQGVAAPLAAGTISTFVPEP